MFKARSEGDIMLMDASVTESWRELTTYGCNKEWWRSRVRTLRQPWMRVEIGEHVEEGADYTVSM